MEKNPIKIQNDKFWEHLRASFLEKKSRLFLWLYSLYFLQKFWEHFEASILEKKSNNFQIVSNLWNIVRLWFWLANRLILSHYDVFNAVLWLVKSSVVESSVFSLTNQLEVKKFAWIFFPKMTLWNVPKILKFENCFLERKITYNCQFWIFFPEMTLPEVPKRFWIFFPKMTLTEFPGFLVQIMFITWYLTRMASRDFGHLTYRGPNYCSFE